MLGILSLLPFWYEQSDSGLVNQIEEAEFYNISASEVWR